MGDSAIGDALLEALSDLSGFRLAFAQRVLLDNPSRSMLTSSSVHEVLDELQEKGFSDMKDSAIIERAISTSQAQRKAQLTALKADPLETSGGDDWMSQPGRRKLYFCLGSDKLVIINTEYDDMSTIPFRISLSHIKTLIVSNSDSVIFGIVAVESNKAKVGKETPIYLRFVARQRRNVLEALQIAWKTHHMKETYEIDSLSIEFSSYEKVMPQLKRDETREHIHSDRLRRFYRCGYIFDADLHFVDSNESMKQRPYSTYTYTLTEEENAEAKPISPHNQSRMLLRIEPIQRRRCSDFRNTNSCLNLRLWVETLAHTIAHHNAAGEAYIVFENVPFEKENEPDAFWTGFRVSIGTTTRHIGIIGLRRNFLPPLGDSYQDIALIYMDATIKPSTKIKPSLDVNFCQPLIDMATSLRPSDACKSLPEKTLSTYDLVFLQAQANALNWLSVDSELMHWMSSVLEIRPTVQVLGVQWRHITFAFCGSIVRLLPGRKSTGRQEDSSEARQWKRIEELGFVDDPLAVVKRIEEEISRNVEKEAGNPVTASLSPWNWSHPGLPASIPDPTLLHSNIMLRARTCVASRIASAVDGGENVNLPVKVSVHMLSKLAQENACEHADTFHRVLDYLLFARESGHDFKQDTSLYSKLNMDSILRNLECNERVAIELLAVDLHYIEVLPALFNPSLSPSEATLEGERILCNFLFSLLQKNYNLQLVKAVCTKISNSRISEDSCKVWMPLLPPLTALAERGNIFFQRWTIEALAVLSSSESIGHELLSNSNILRCAMSNLEESHDSQLIQVSLQLLRNLLCLCPNFDSLLAELIPSLERLLVPVVRGQRFNADVNKEVAVLISRLSSQDGHRGRISRQELLAKDFVGLFVPFLERHRDYEPIVHYVAAALGCLFYQCDKSFKQQSLARVPLFCRLLLASAGRRRRCVILQILRNLSYKSFPVLNVMRKQGIDKLLKSFSDTIATQKATASKTELRLLVKEKRLLTLLQARVERRLKIQICFLLESSRGMGVWMKELAESIDSMHRTIQSAIELQHLEASVETAFVSYRGVPDQYKASSFEPPSVTQMRMRNLVAFGNPKGFGAADLLGAMLFAIDEFQWNADCKFFVVVANKPCYGRAFHSSVFSDPYAEKLYGEHKLSGEQVLAEVAQLDAHVVFQCLSPTLTQMLNAFEEGLGSGRVSELQQLDGDVMDQAQFCTQQVARITASTFINEFC